MVYVVANLADDTNTQCPPPDDGDNCKHWVRERSQRDQILTGLRYGVATISRLLKILGLFCRIQFLL